MLKEWIFLTVKKMVFLLNIKENHFFKQLKKTIFKHFFNAVGSSQLVDMFRSKQPFCFLTHAC